jgi:glycine cleavage system H protein
MTLPQTLKYTSSHEWVRVEADGSITVGITAHAQELLGDIVFVDLPKIDASFDAGAECLVVESVKAAADVYAPVSGTVTAVNETLGGEPELVNSDPYQAGWLFKMAPSNATELANLLDAAGYEAIINDES